MRESKNTALVLRIGIVNVAVGFDEDVKLPRVTFKVGYLRLSLDLRLRFCFSACLACENVMYRVTGN